MMVSKPASANVAMWLIPALGVVLCGPRAVAQCENEVAVLIDASSHAQDTWHQQLHLAETLVGAMDIGPDTNGVAVVTYQTTSTLHSALTYDRNTVTNALDSISANVSPSGDPHMGAALATAPGILDPGREGADRVIFLLTTEASEDDPVPVAADLREGGVRIAGVTFAGDPDEALLDAIADPWISATASDSLNALVEEALYPDTDGDGTPDCLDECPDDPHKTEPGRCGCGVPEDECAEDGDAGVGDAGVIDGGIEAGTDGGLDASVDPDAGEDADAPVGDGGSDAAASDASTTDDAGGDVPSDAGVPDGGARIDVDGGPDPHDATVMVDAGLPPQADAGSDAAAAPLDSSSGCAVATASPCNGGPLGPVMLVMGLALATRRLLRRRPG